MRAFLHFVCVLLCVCGANRSLAPANRDNSQKSRACHPHVELRFSVRPCAKLWTWVANFFVLGEDGATATPEALLPRLALHEVPPQPQKESTERNRVGVDTWR